MGRDPSTREEPLYKRLFHRCLSPANPCRQRVPSCAPGLRTPSGQLLPRPPPSPKSLSPQLSPCSDLRHSFCKLLCDRDGSWCVKVITESWTVISAKSIEEPGEEAGVPRYHVSHFQPSTCLATAPLSAVFLAGTCSSSCLWLASPEETKAKESPCPVSSLDVIFSPPGPKGLQLPPVPHLSLCTEE